MNLSWQKDSACSRTENRGLLYHFFSSEPAERYIAKNLCFTCPVRRDCLKWALETRQINGVWGGKDEGEIRRTLSVSWSGQEVRRQRFPHCPFCNARPGKLRTLIANTPNGGRWTTMRLVKCSVCEFTWRSRTSANAVDLFHVQRIDQLEKQAARKEKEQLQQSKKKKKMT